MWKREGQTYMRDFPFNSFGEIGLQLKVVNSETGPGRVLGNALWNTGNVTNEVSFYSLFVFFRCFKMAFNVSKIICLFMRLM